MNKKFWFASLSATTLAGLLLVNNNQVKATTTQEGTTPADPIQDVCQKEDQRQMVLQIRHARAAAMKVLKEGK